MVRQAPSIYLEKCAMNSRDISENSSDLGAVT